MPPAPLRALALAGLVVPQVAVVAVQGPAPLLLREAPLVLLALHPFAPWSLLVATRTGVLEFVAVVVLVRTVPCCGDYLLGRWYGPRALDRLARDHAVLLREKIHREVHAVEIAAGNRQIARLLGTAGEHDGIEVGGDR